MLSCRWLLPPAKEIISEKEIHETDLPKKEIAPLLYAAEKHYQLMSSTTSLKQSDLRRSNKDLHIR
jgi:hypothetical protein